MFARGLGGGGNGKLLTKWYTVFILQDESLEINSGDSCTAILMYLIILEKTLESPLDSKEIKPVNAKGNQA